MESVNLIESFSLFKEDKNIDRATLMSIIEDVFRTMLIKKYGSDKNFDIIVNPDKGDIEIYKNRTIVDDEFAERVGGLIDTQFAGPCLRQYAARNCGPVGAIEQ